MFPSQNSSPPDLRSAALMIQDYGRRAWLVACGTAGHIPRGHRGPRKGQAGQPARGKAPDPHSNGLDQRTT